MNNVPNQDRKSTAVLIIFAIFLVVINLLVFNLADTSAQGTPLPTPTPLGNPIPPSLGAGFTQPLGGTLILHVFDAPPQAWTAVQWQDANDGWHTVEGWQSQLTDGYVGWWVAPKDFATGPFRWQMYDEEGGTLIGTSTPFDLPEFIDHTVIISIDSP